MQMVDTALAPFRPEHLDGAVSLSGQAGWPHRKEDWQLALALSEGFVALGDAGEVVGTILVTAYGADCATINMVIVDEKMRGRGLGRELMDAAFRFAGKRALRLIATADGLPLYEKTGFAQVGAIHQHQGIVGDVSQPENVELATADDIVAIKALDKAAFGADRSNLIDRLSELGAFAVIRREGKVLGFAAIRAFGRGEVVGPVVAENIEDAKALITYFMSLRAGKFLRVDTNADTDLSPWLAEMGLAHVGGGIAMVRPLNFNSTASAVTTFALANQALG